MVSCRNTVHSLTIMTKKLFRQTETQLQLEILIEFPMQNSEWYILALLIMINNKF